MSSSDDSLILHQSPKNQRFASTTEEERDMILDDVDAAATKKKTRHATKVFRG